MFNDTNSLSRHALSFYSTQRTLQLCVQGQSTKTETDKEKEEWEEKEVAQEDAYHCRNEGHYETKCVTHELQAQ